MGRQRAFAYYTSNAFQNTHNALRMLKGFSFPYICTFFISCFVTKKSIFRVQTFSSIFINYSLRLHWWQQLKACQSYLHDWKKTTFEGFNTKNPIWIQMKTTHFFNINLKLMVFFLHLVFSLQIPPSKWGISMAPEQLVFKENESWDSHWFMARDAQNTPITHYQNRNNPSKRCRCINHFPIVKLAKLDFSTHF